MRKISTIAFALLLTLSVTGCQKWLEATSSSQISSEKLFSSRAGFHEALSGIYLLMGSTSCYGMNYTWFVNELTAAPLASQNAALYSDFQNNRYSTIRTTPYIEDMWQSGYNIIANVNKLLLELDSHRDIRSDQMEYSRIRGELLAIRAYVHYDLICMFGLPSWDGENASKLTIPYVTVYQKEPTAQHGYAETAALLNADIDEAIDLLAVDPIRGSVPEDFNESLNADGYWNKRTYHLNWYAARALKARVLVQQKEYDAAAKLAREILDEVLEKEVVHWIDPVEQFNIVDTDGIHSRDWTFSCEHLFTLNIPDYYDIVRNYFFAQDAAHGNYLLLSESTVTDLYQYPYIVEGDEYITLVGDMRGPSLMLVYSAMGYRIYKYYTSGTEVQTRQPMIRISELCFICAEAAIRNGDLDTMAEYINLVNSHRGIEDKVTPGNAVNLRNNPFFFLWKEYVREFISEGRIFNFRKRCESEIAGSGLSGSSDELMLRSRGALTYPYPTEETSYGHIQEL